MCHNRLPLRPPWRPLVLRRQKHLLHQQRGVGLVEHHRRHHPLQHADLRRRSPLPPRRRLLQACGRAAEASARCLPQLPPRLLHPRQGLRRRRLRHRLRRHRRRVRGRPPRHRLRPGEGGDRRALRRRAAAVPGVPARVRSGRRRKVRLRRRLDVRRRRRLRAHDVRGAVRRARGAGGAVEQRRVFVCVRRRMERCAVQRGQRRRLVAALAVHRRQPRRLPLPPPRGCGSVLRGAPPPRRRLLLLRTTQAGAGGGAVRQGRRHRRLRGLRRPLPAAGARPRQQQGAHRGGQPPRSGEHAFRLRRLRPGRRRRSSTGRERGWGQGAAVGCVGDGHGGCGGAVSCAGGGAAAAAAAAATGRVGAAADDDDGGDGAGVGAAAPQGGRVGAGPQPAQQHDLGGAVHPARRLGGDDGEAAAAAAGVVRVGGDDRDAVLEEGQQRRRPPLVGQQDGAGACARGGGDARAAAAEALERQEAQQQPRAAHAQQQPPQRRRQPCEDAEEVVGRRRPGRPARGGGAGRGAEQPAPRAAEGEGRRGDGGAAAAPRPVAERRGVPHVRHGGGEAGRAAVPPPVAAEAGCAAGCVHAQAGGDPRETPVTHVREPRSINRTTKTYINTHVAKAPEAPSCECIGARKSKK
eukprot:Rhum_TRINITY_DN12042_c1_g1::Rhum_TRINITY_DN12042_c1_g1_i1::g.48962::m.48962